MTTFTSALDGGGPFCSRGQTGPFSSGPEPCDPNKSSCSHDGRGTARSGAPGATGAAGAAGCGAGPGSGAFGDAPPFSKRRNPRSFGKALAGPGGVR